MRVLIPTSEHHHGAAIHARQVAALVTETGVQVVTAGAADVAHAQFTDALWGADIYAAAAAYERWAASVPAPVIVTLHDVPGGDGDRGRDARRSAGYARVVAASDGVIVSSKHEATKVTRLSGRPPRFIELPILAVAPPTGHTDFDWADGPTLGLLGFLYPGKGHAEAIDAAARQSPVPGVVSLGAVSPGHQVLHRHLERRAAQRGVRFVVTGPLPESGLVAAATAVTVGLAPNRAVSASASLLAWFACRRRPVVARGDYSEEIADRHPGRMLLYDTVDELDEAIAGSILDPERTRPDAVAPWPDVGAQHLQAYCDLLGVAQVADAAR